MHTAMEKIWNRPTSHVANGNAVRSCQRVERLGEIELCSAAARAMEPKCAGTGFVVVHSVQKRNRFQQKPSRSARTNPPNGPKLTGVDPHTESYQPWDSRGAGPRPVERRVGRPAKMDSS